MMDHGAPEQKRPRIESWSKNLPQERPPQPPPPPPPPPQQERPHLPLPPPPLRQPYSHEGNSPFSGPENPLNPRRHSEQQAQYEPDPRRPNSGSHSGPSHAYLPHHSHSAPHTAPPYVPPAVGTMKRDPGEDHVQQYNRPSSRGNGPPEHGLGAQHPYGHHPPYEGQAPPPNVIPFRPPGGYANPHSPMAGNEPYPHPNFGASPHQGQRPEMYSSVSYPQQGPNVVKRKAQRAAQACDSCRGLKAKCDEGRPICSTCKEKGFPCVYRDPPPKQQDKTQSDILEGMLEMKTLLQSHIARMTTLVGGLSENFEDLAGKVDRIEREMKPATATIQNSNLKEDERQHTSLLHIPRYVDGSADFVANSENISESPHPSPSTPGGPMRIGAEGLEADEETGDPVNPGPSSIPVNHTTGAARLLLVPPIADLAKGLKTYSTMTAFDKYPMLLEERRGLLRSFGRGEGQDRPPGYEREPLIDHGLEGTPSDTTSDPATPPGEEWGQIGGLTPPPDDAPISRIGEDSRLGLGVNSEGLPDLSHGTVQLLVKSYIDNMNIMHPILVPQRLETLVDIFLKSIPETQSKYKPPPPPERVSAGFIGSRAMDSPGAKRKRSYAATVENFEAHSTWGHKPGHPFRSISTCLVLLVMALGSICLHKSKIPDVVSDKDIDDLESASPASRNGHPRSPMVTTPMVNSATGLPSPQEAVPRSRRTSLDGPHMRPGTNLKLKNLDVIPGLSYFAIATDIIGNQIGGNSLQHVHVNILAGLYQGQLGRVLESQAYIANACRALQVILRPKLDRFKKSKAENVVILPADNPLVFAFWTCLQLESDIVAELPVPMSGILTYEDDMPLPNVKAAVEENFDPVHIESYMTQLNLRKHLNQLHTMFYKPEESDENEASKTPYYPTIAAVEANLEGIKSSAPRMKWNEDEPPATDILGARLRAKYYGAEVITYRSFVLKVLLSSSEKSPKIGNIVLNQFKDEVMDPISDPTQDEQFSPEFLRYARRCIQALVKSTTAFHGLGDPGKDRLIVTNIWGTAHAQWGNVLTLLAAYQDPVLSQWIDKKLLKNLLDTTLSFLELHMQPSSALAMDHRVLKYAGRQTGLLPSKTKAAQFENTSFGSNSSGDVTMSGY